MKLKDLCKDDRPRERMLLGGAVALSNAELLAVVMRAGTRELNVVELSRNLLAAAGGSLIKLSQVPVQELCQMKGVGEGKALAVLSALELGRRMMQENNSVNGQLIVSPEDVYRLMIPIMKGLDHEECWALWLGRSGRAAGKEMLSSGDDCSTTIDAAALARKAVASKARRVILIHNHPSGEPLPSPSDIRLTTEVKDALKLFRIKLTDHIILSDGAFYSFSREVVTPC